MNNNAIQKSLIMATSRPVGIYAIKGLGCRAAADPASAD